jgi:hypothetical protein
MQKKKGDSDEKQYGSDTKQKGLGLAAVLGYWAHNLYKTQKTFECYPVKLERWNSNPANWLFP